MQAVPLRQIAEDSGGTQARAAAGLYAIFCVYLIYTHFNDIVKGKVACTPLFFTFRALTWKNRSGRGALHGHLTAGKVLIV